MMKIVTALLILGIITTALTENVGKTRSLSGLADKKPTIIPGVVVEPIILEQASENNKFQYVETAPQYVSSYKPEPISYPSAHIAPYPYPSSPPIATYPPPPPIATYPPPPPMPTYPATYQPSYPGRSGVCYVECPAGPPGPIGAPGLMGPEGLSGDKGDQGDQGRDGSPGGQGPKGTPGPMGPPGDKGKMGEKGMPGQRGKQGSPGQPGKPGQPGSPGSPGKKGPPGPKGNTGKKGPQAD